MAATSTLPAPAVDPLAQPQAFTEGWVEARYGRWNAGLGRRFAAVLTGEAGTDHLTRDSLVASYVYHLERDARAQQHRFGERMILGNDEHDLKMLVEARNALDEAEAIRWECLAGPRDRCTVGCLDRAADRINTAAEWQANEHARCTAQADAAADKGLDQVEGYWRDRAARHAPQDDQPQDAGMILADGSSPPAGAGR